MMQYRPGIEDVKATVEREQPNVLVSAMQSCGRLWSLTDRRQHSLRHRCGLLSKYRQVQSSSTFHAGS